jgi:hypothetical protein
MLPPAEVGRQLWTRTAVHSQGICRAIAHSQQVQKFLSDTGVECKLCDTVLNNIIFF